MLLDLFSRTPGNQDSAEQQSSAREAQGGKWAHSHTVHIWQNHLGTQEPRLEHPSSF